MKHHKKWNSTKHNNQNCSKKTTKQQEKLSTRQLNNKKNYQSNNKTTKQQKKSQTTFVIWLSCLKLHCFIFWKKAASYSPALHCSTIGASGLNFSVRNGKRWNTTAITTWCTSFVSVTFVSVSWVSCTPGTSFLYRDSRIGWLSHKTNLRHANPSVSLHTVENMSFRQWRKVFGLLVRLGFDVTVFTPASYQRRSLRRPSKKELSSCGWLRT